MNGRMPTIFFGHGNPMNAITKNRFAAAWERIGSETPRPRAILAVSAHWYISETAVTAMTQPRTIHDFGGFPSELYAVDYPAPGSPDLARRVRDLLAPIPVRLDETWGLDHGTWSVLCHIFPAADIPIVQLSLDRRQPPQFHYDLGKSLAPLRDEGILIIGSGDTVHNLRAYDWGDPATPAHDWGARFEGALRRHLLSGEDDPLIDYGRFGEDARLSVPTPDHYLPLLTVLGARSAGEAVEFPVEGFEGGSISMLTIRFPGSFPKC